MPYNFLKLCSSLLFSFFVLSGHAQSFGVVMDSSEAQSGQIVCVPVYAQGFAGIVGYQYSLEFNPQVLSFHHSQHFGLPDMSSINFNLYQPGVITTAWADPVAAGVSRSNGATLFEVCFTAIGALGTDSWITPGGILPPDVGGANVYNAAGEDVWNPDQNVRGYVEITLAAATKEASSTNESLQISPNPTSASAQVSVKSIQSAQGTLNILDAAGRQVLEQKITLRPGDNVFEISAKTLNAKGMYQVYVQTEYGTSTQMLSVN